MYFLYIISCPAYADQDICKIGCTTEPHSRLQAYFTSYPPGMIPYDIHYYGIWEIEAEDEQDMRYKEGIIHDEFYLVRKKRDVSSEWFQIKIETVAAFIESCDFTKRQINLNDLPRKPRSPLETVVYQKNRKLFVRNETTKNTKLNEIQAPVIQAIQDFIISEEFAGQIIAPCGSGKTIMTCNAVRHLKKIVVCVPSVRIQTQWQDSLKPKNCLFIGGNNNWNKECLTLDEFCIITTYASCKKLIDILPVSTDIIIFDEAHHMAGMVSDNKEAGEYITRALLKTLVDRNMKRLFLTFTPKDGDEDDENVFGMNKEKIFGKVIYELKLRKLIEEGILPDYIIWALSSQGAGLEGKREQILSAWNSNQIHHLIVFVSLKAEKEELVKYFKNKNVDNVFSIDDDTKDPNRIIEQYTKSTRAIIVDCLKLGEGVDIPIADSVAVMYPIESVVKAVQMILRPGRWYKNKSIFHILIPHTIDEDMSGIQSVLISLARCDEALRGELLLSNSSDKKDSSDNSLTIGFSSEHCNIETISSLDVEKMKQCFQNIRSSLISKTNKKEIQKLCIQRNVKTSKEYEELRNELTHLPEDPRYNGTTWFDFLNPTTEKVSIQQFGHTVIENNKRLPSEYINWNSEVKFPSLQNIRDGYFGEDRTNFLEIVEKFAPLERRRR